MDVALPLIGVIVGGALTGVFLLLSKRQERLAQLHRVISERRIDAYEEIITEIRWLKLGVGDLVDEKYVKWPMSLENLEEWDKWFGGYVVHSARVSHYIDDELSDCLMDIQNYLHNLEHVVLEKARTLSPDQWDAYLRGPGQLLYEDFRVLANRCMGIASKFYETGLYKRYRPSSRSFDTTSSIPDYFRELNLFRRRDDVLARLR